MRLFLKKVLTNETGSASVEFTVLAIPLFLPLFLYMNSFASMSDGQDSLRTLVREAARGFVTSSNDEIAFGVAREIVTQGATILGYKEGLDNGDIQLSIICSTNPCISPNASIKIQLTRKSDRNPEIRVSAIEYVSPWV